MFGRNLDNTRFYSLLKNAESKIFCATKFDIDKKHTIAGTIKAKWVEATQTYHYKAYPMDDYADTGKKNADQVKYSTLETPGKNINHSVARKLNAGQGLEFESLSPADSGTPDSGDANGDAAPPVATPPPSTSNGDNSNGDGAIKGCTDSTAENYDATATEDDGSCEFGEDEDNTLLYGGIGVGVLALILLTRK